MPTRIVVLFLLFTSVISDIGAAGIVIIQPPITSPPRTQPRIVPSRPVQRAITLEKQHTTAVINDQIARTTIEQVFHNPNSRQLEGTFLFPVPKGAQLDGFTLRIDGEQKEAELLDSGKAQKIYEDIVRSMKDPGLLQYAGRDLYKIRIFPFPARGNRTITLSYTQVLKADDGIISYSAPMSASKPSTTPPNSVTLDLSLRTGKNLKSVWSPSHDVDISRQDRAANVRLKIANAHPKSDFQLFYSADDSEVGASLFTHRTGDQDGYFLLLLSPGDTGNKVMPKDVTFVLDTSGSMAGDKIRQARKALEFCVENLNTNDRFEVLRFATEVEPLFDGLAKANEKNRQRAGEFIGDLKPLGSTAINDALQTAVSLRPKDSARPYVIIFLTDGRPTIGVTREDEIVSNVTRNKSDLTRIFTFGLGTDVNTHLLDRITEKTRAFSQYVLPKEDLEVKLSSFFTRIKNPVMSDLTLDFPDGVRTSQYYPRYVPDLFKGDQLMVVGRYRGNGKGNMQLRGIVNGSTQTRNFDMKFPKKSGKHAFLPRLWATRRVGYFLDELRIHGSNPELKQEITQLARQYGIVTPYTAYLIVEDERRQRIDLTQSLLPRLGGSPEARRQITRYYSTLAGRDSGRGAVAGAQSTLALKQAGSADAATARANRLIAPAVTAPAPAPAPKPKRSPAKRPSTSFRIPPTPVAAPAAPITSTPMAQTATRPTRARAEYTTENTHVAGKTFYRNAEKWMDSEVQALTKKGVKPTIIRFASSEYFELLHKHPIAAKWLAVGKQVSVAINGKIYSIVP